MLRRSALVLVALAACHRAPPPHANGTACSATSECASLSRCDFRPDLCGTGRTPGTCTPRPNLCSDRYDPICGCDGKIYPNACAAEVAGVDFDINGGACHQPKIPHFIACGGRYCDARTSYCEIVLSDVRELPSDYTCK